MTTKPIDDLPANRDPDIKRNARSAMNAFVERSGVFILPGSGRDKPEHVGSGVVLRSDAGVHVVLTAAHVASDAKTRAHRLGYIDGEDVLQDFVAGVVVHDDRDVGLLVIKPDLGNVVAPFAITIQEIAEDDVVEDRHSLLLTGFPAALVGNRVVNPKVIEFGFRQLAYGTGLGEPARDDRGRLRIAWTERDTPDGPTKMFPPGGISGGALWRFTAVPDSEIWAPAKGRIIGIASTWDSESTEFAEPVTAWREWLVEKLRGVDEDFAR